MVGCFETASREFYPEAPGIRNCQRGGYYAALAHFTHSRQPCLIGLPTGSGKTALMMALCYGLRAHRTLIITPATILRSQTAGKFRTLDDLRLATAIPCDTRGPEVLEVLNEFQEPRDWDACLPYDVIVATTKTTSPKEKRVCAAPEGLFDLVFLDEAHHSPAATWTALLEWFSVAGTKAVLLTGTPYRRDRIEINAELIYDYPISLAVQDNIYAPVRFVDAGKPVASRDRKLARKALAVRERISREYGEVPLMLIKTDRIKHATELCHLYRELGANVLAIHTELSARDNEGALKSLREGGIDGIVAVGMIGEGLDVPNLKMAVFHRNPQSLPHTIQLIGRLARTGTQVTQGTVVGFSDDFSRETFALYDASPDWFRLVPDLERKLIAGRVGVPDDQALMEGQNFLYDSDLTPFFSVSAFQFPTEAATVQLDAIRAWTRRERNESISVERVSVFEGDTVVIVTKSAGLPDWLRSGGYSRILQTEFHLHVFYQHGQVVLEHSTRPQIASMLREKLFPSTLDPVDREKLNHALSSGDGSYLAVGLRNSAGFSQANPSYKMLLGAEAQAAVTNADTKVFHTGHCLMRLKRFERRSAVRGIAYKNGKVWELKRDNLRRFREWCLAVSAALLEEGLVQLPGLDRLRRTERICSFPEEPLAVVPDVALLTRTVQFIPSEEGSGVEYSGWPDVTIETHDSTRIECVFPELGASFAIALDDNGDIHYEPVAGPAYSVRVDPVAGVMKTYPGLASFLVDYPPGVIFLDGSTLTDGLYSKPVHTPDLDTGVVRGIDWGGCDIHSEMDDTEHGMGVQNFVATRLIPSQAQDTVVVCDHGSGEIADLITLDFHRKVVGFYHVKAARIKSGQREKPGSRQADLRDVLFQAVCSARWVRNVGFANELSRRTDQRAATRMTRGQRSQITDFRNEYAPATWSFEVIAVQPAFRDRGMSKETKTMIASAQDYLVSAGATFQLFCSA